MEYQSSNKLKILISIEFYSLLACIFSIPLFETPKNIFLTLSSLCFVIRHLIEGNLSLNLFTRDLRIGFLLISFSALISSFFSMYPLLSIRGFLDFLKIYLIFIIIKDFIDARYIKIFLMTIILSTTIGTLWGIAEIIENKSIFFELKSVGHVNHSAIYLALSLVLFLPLIWKKFYFNRLFLLIVNFIIFSGIIIAGSRATIGALFIAIVIMLFFYNDRKKIIITMLILSLVSILLFFVISNPIILSKNTSLSDNSLIERINIWNDALNMFKSNPIFGVGAKHFKFYSTSPSGSHAHNLYLNFLAQYGIVGILCLFYLIIVLFNELKNSNKKNILWYSGLGAVVVVIVNGILNTTLHSEHGLLFAIICSICFQRKNNLH